MDMKELEQRLTRLEDIEAIKQLKARYCEICDDDHNPERITSVFAEDGIWEGKDFGTAKGHPAIRDLFRGFQKLIKFSQHNVMNPIIEVDGNRAKGSWYFTGPFTFHEKNEARWLILRYEDDYVKINGKWVYQHLRVFVRLNASHDKGWSSAA
jgi:hypothetical protein